MRATPACHAQRQHATMLGCLSHLLMGLCNACQSGGTAFLGSHIGQVLDHMPEGSRGSISNSNAPWQSTWAVRTFTMDTSQMVWLTLPREDV